jgi:hypothetical protein
MVLEFDSIPKCANAIRPFVVTMSIVCLVISILICVNSGRLIFRTGVAVGTVWFCSLFATICTGVVSKKIYVDSCDVDNIPSLVLWIEFFLLVCSLSVCRDVVNYVILFIFRKAIENGTRYYMFIFTQTFLNFLRNTVL